jgi:hypothetical protein
MREGNQRESSKQERHRMPLRWKHSRQHHHRHTGRRAGERHPFGIQPHASDPGLHARNMIAHLDED